MKSYNARFRLLSKRITTSLQSHTCCPILTTGYHQGKKDASSCVRCKSPVLVYSRGSTKTNAHNVKTNIPKAKMRSTEDRSHASFHPILSPLGLVILIPTASFP